MILFKNQLWTAPDTPCSRVVIIPGHGGRGWRKCSPWLEKLSTLFSKQCERVCLLVTRSVCECVRSKKIKKIQYQGIYLKFKSKQHNPKERMQRIVWHVCVGSLREGDNSRLHPHRAIQGKTSWYCTTQIDLLKFMLKHFDQIIFNMLYNKRDNIKLLKKFECVA